MKGIGRRGEGEACALTGGYRLASGPLVLASYRESTTLHHDGCGFVSGDARSTVFVYSSIDVCTLRELNNGGGDHADQGGN